MSEACGLALDMEMLLPEVGDRRTVGLSVRHEVEVSLGSHKMAYMRRQKAAVRIG